METQVVYPNGIGMPLRNQQLPLVQSTSKPFIQANTIECTLEEIQREHTIPVFLKDNEPVISHSDFIETALKQIYKVMPHETILQPSVRLSHPIKGRIPSAKDKPAKDLLEGEKTLYYERMAFLFEVPTIRDTIGGEELSLSIGGVKSYNLDNLYSRKGAEESFKFFIGFKVSVCTNLCIWSDGYVGTIKVKSLRELSIAIENLLLSFDASSQVKKMASLENYSLTETQFAQMIGRCKLYQFLAPIIRRDITELEFGDAQVSTVCKDYYKDTSFCREDNGEINLWKLYNLFTAANKSSYIDTFLDRSVNASQFVGELQLALDNKATNWFLQ